MCHSSFWHRSRLRQDGERPWFPISTEKCSWKLLRQLRRQERERPGAGAGWVSGARSVSTHSPSPSNHHLGDHRDDEDSGDLHDYMIMMFMLRWWNRPLPFHLYFHEDHQWKEIFQKTEVWTMPNKTLLFEKYQTYLHKIRLWRPCFGMKVHLLFNQEKETYDPARSK